MSKSYRLHCTTLSIIVVFLAFTGVSKPLVLWEIERTDEQEIIETINSYFSLRYKTLQNSDPLDFSTNSDSQEANTVEWLKLESDKRDIEMLIHTAYDLRISDFNYHLDFKIIDVEENKAIVNLLESNEVTYQNNPKYPSSMADLEHEISLIKTKVGWVIIRDIYSDDLIRLLNSTPKDEILKNIADNNDRNISNMPNIEQSVQILQSTSITSGLQMYDYDNSAAATYADYNYNQAGLIPSTIREIDGWDSSWPTSFKVYTSDCTNFVSQAVFEGISFTASDPNYFYPDSNHYSDWWYYKFSTTSDGSSRWVNAGGFYTFLTTNYFNYNSWEIGIRGPAGYGIDLCNIQVGDLVFLQSQSVWQHVVIVDQVGPNPCNTNNVYVAAHSTNHKRRPLSEYSGYLMYPVEIKGYLDEMHPVFLPLVNKSGDIILNTQTTYPAPADTHQPIDLISNPYPEP